MKKILILMITFVAALLGASGTSFATSVFADAYVEVHWSYRWATDPFTGEVFDYLPNGIFNVSGPRNLVSSSWVDEVNKQSSSIVNGVFSVTNTSPKLDIYFGGFVGASSYTGAFFGPLASGDYKYRASSLVYVNSLLSNSRVYSPLKAGDFRPK